MNRINQTICKPLVRRCITGSVGTGLTFAAMAPMEMNYTNDMYNVGEDVAFETKYEQPGKYDDVDNAAKSILNTNFTQGVNLNLVHMDTSPLQQARAEANLNYGKPKTENDPAGIGANCSVQVFNIDGSVVIGTMTEDFTQARYFTPIGNVGTFMVVGNISGSGAEDLIMTDIQVPFEDSTFHCRTQHVAQGHNVNLSYMQAIAPNTAAGVEMSHFFGQGSAFSVKGSFTTYSDKKSDTTIMPGMEPGNDNKRSITTGSVSMMGVATLNHYQKISPNVSAAIEYESNMAQQTQTVTVGTKVDVNNAVCHVTASTNGQILSTVQFAPAVAPQLNVTACAGFDYKQSAPTFGVSFEYEV